MKLFEKRRQTPGHRLKEIKLKLFLKAFAIMGTKISKHRYLVINKNESINLGRKFQNIG